MNAKTNANYDAFAYIRSDSNIENDECNKGNSQYAYYEKNSIADHLEANSY